MGSVRAGAHRPILPASSSSLPPFPPRLYFFLRLSVPFVEKSEREPIGKFIVGSRIFVPSSIRSKGNGGERKSSAARIEGKLAFNGA